MTGEYREPRRAAGHASAWLELEAPPALGADEVHVWRCSLAASDGQYRRFLSPDEISRADRFASAIARRRFVVRRAFLRRILSFYTGGSPESIAFTYGARGKPALDGNNDGAIDFNQSDSGDWTVVCVSKGIPNGIDIETLQFHINTDVMSEVFTTKERSELESIEGGYERRLAFFNGWTRKEAAIKADGAGLGFPLQDIEVSLDPAQPARLHRFGENGTESWSLLTFEVAADIVGAVLVKRPEASLRLLQLSPRKP